jgi:hypothetical protein
VVEAVVRGYLGGLGRLDLELDLAFGISCN